MPTRSFANGKVRLSSQQYSRFVELRGQLTVIGGMNFEQRLEKLVLSPGFGRLSTFDQQEVIRSIASDYTRAAKNRLLTEYPDLSDRINSVEALKRVEAPSAQDQMLVEALLTSP